MTRAELLTILISQARENGFEFRRWYTARLGLPWISAQAAVAILDTQRRYYALLFSHEFASAFWKPGARFTLQMKERTYFRKNPDGTFRESKTKAHMRRTAKADAWQYHLGQMAAAEEPLRYIRRYLHVADEVTLPEDEVVAAPIFTPIDAGSGIKRTLLLARSAAERRSQNAPRAGKPRKSTSPKTT